MPRQPADLAARRALVVNGTVGVGKTTVAEAVHDRLTAAGVPNAVLDLDWMRRSWPVPADDPFNTAMERRNVAAVARNYVAAGCVRLVLAGVLERRADRAAYRELLGVDLDVCRLVADPDVVRARLARRHAGDEHAYTWHADRSVELTGILDAAGVDDVTVDATEAPVTTLAVDVLAAVGWLA